MIASRQTAADHFTAAVGQEYRRIVAEHGIAQGGFYANTRRASRENNGARAQASKPFIEVSLKESAVVVFVNHHV